MSLIVIFPLTICFIVAGCVLFSISIDHFRGKDSKDHTGESKTFSDNNISYVSPAKDVSGNIFSNKERFNGH